MHILVKNGRDDKNVENNMEKFRLTKNIIMNNLNLFDNDSKKKVLL